MAHVGFIFSGDAENKPSEFCSASGLHEKIRDPY
jgi:hypothetical protein